MKMHFCTIDTNYLDHLRSKEPRIPHSDYGENHYKPFFHTLFVVDGLAYVTQVTSPKERHRHMHNTLDFKKLFIETNNFKKGKRTRFYVGAVNLNYMFPVPTDKLKDLDFGRIEEVRSFENDKKRQKYVYFLKQELKAINELHLENAAQKLYRVKYSSPEAPVSKRSLDFKQLEQYAKQYKD